MVWVTEKPTYFSPVFVALHRWQLLLELNVTKLLAILDWVRTVRTISINQFFTLFYCFCIKCDHVLFGLIRAANEIIQNGSIWQYKWFDTFTFRSMFVSNISMKCVLCCMKILVCNRFFFVVADFSYQDGLSLVICHLHFQNICI